jgi:hypothetical protein
MHRAQNLLVDRDLDQIRSAGIGCDHIDTPQTVKDQTVQVYFRMQNPNKRGEA